ncbi:MAG: amidase family protein [Myxococcota bacterium]
MRLDEYVRYDALGLAELLRGGEVGREELLETALEAIDAVNPQLNAVISDLRERGRAGARQPQEGLFSGVPFLLKDNIDLEGTVSTWGTVLGQGRVSTWTHEVVRRIEASGLVILGRTNMSELGLLPTTEPAAFGPTANPWDLRRSPGGSSGGAGAAVAGGMVPMAHGADGGGSIRIPASACGLFGLKTSRGRHPASREDDPDGFISQGVLSKSVRDSAAFLDVTQGARSLDRWRTPSPLGSFLEAAGTDPQPLRIAFSVRGFDGREVHPHCREAVLSAAQLCADLGHSVEEGGPQVDFQEWMEGFAVLWSMCTGYFLESVKESLRADGLSSLISGLLERNAAFDALLWAHTFPRARPMEPFTRTLVGINRRLTPGHLWMAWKKMNRAGEALGGFLETVDLFMLPVLGEPPWPTGHLKPPRTVDEAGESLLRYAGFTPICNTAGLPAMSVPLHWAPSGLPIGVQFMAPYGREDLLFALAGQLERARGWSHLRPPTFAARRFNASDHGAHHARGPLSSSSQRDSKGDLSGKERRQIGPDHLSQRQRR